jgi:putative redox protein
MTTPPNPTETKKVWLRWSGTEREYTGGAGEGGTILLDGFSVRGPGPMDTLLLAVAGCMAVDVQVILERSRVPLTGLSVEVEGERAPTHPKRYTRIRMVYHLDGPREEHQGKVDRAVDLSREKFCSVLHSLRPDIEIEIDIRRV